jgi:hypothetical protein
VLSAFGFIFHDINTFLMKTINDKNYNIDIHKHNFAVWAASTAASASPICRFKVSEGKAILENIGFVPSFTIDDLPSSDVFDDYHLKWRNQAIFEASKQNKIFSHGLAAKLINCYFKVRFICGESINNEKINHIHPPIDSLLLITLSKIRFGSNDGKDWRRFNNMRWSKFNAEQYQNVIDAIKAELKENPLWTIEQHWPIHE